MQFEWVKLPPAKVGMQHEFYLIVKPIGMDIYVKGDFKVILEGTFVVHEDGSTNLKRVEFWMNVSAIKWNEKLRKEDENNGTKVALKCIEEA